MLNPDFSSQLQDQISGALVQAPWLNLCLRELEYSAPTEKNHKEGKRLEEDAQVQQVVFKFSLFL